MAVTPEPLLCPKGVWMTEEDAIESNYIKATVVKVYRTLTCPENMHFENGGKVSAAKPYDQHKFVYISPEGTKAHFGNITLTKWSRMCDYFSNNTIQTDAAADDEDTTNFREQFEQYTSLKATPANITAAFEKGVMKRSNELQKMKYANPNCLAVSVNLARDVCSLE